jgi:hypothetical protein
MNPHARNRPDVLRREPVTIVALAAVASTLVAAGGTAYQLSQKPPKPPDIASFLPEMPKPAAPPPPPKSLAAPATPAPGTTGASLAAQQQVADEAERNRRRLGRQQTVLTSPVGAQVGGTFLGG